ncbi:MAG: YegS/Rv2252/BmrU family lipid kinase [Lachnospiraceae bacterium]
MKRLLFIYNPRAGKELLKPKLSDIIDIFVKAGYEVTVYPTQAYRDAYKKVLEYDASRYDLIVCSGGDGTIDEVVTGMMHRRERTPVGYIPTGTTNDFANSLHIPKGLLKAADNAVNGVRFPCDIGQFNDDIFVYVAAFGMFTDVSYETKQEVKNILGHLAYVLEGTKRLFNVPSYRIKVTHDGEVIEDEFIFGMVTNSRWVGGFRSMIGKNVAFDDGLFEVTLIKTPTNPIALQEIIAALLIEQIDTKHMYTFKTGHITFESLEEIPWTLDGEFGGEHDEVDIYNLNKELEIMVPGEHVEKLIELPGKVEGEKPEKLADKIKGVLLTDKAEKGN